MALLQLQTICYTSVFLVQQRGVTSSQLITVLLSAGPVRWEYVRVGIKMHLIAQHFSPDVC